MFRVNWKNFWKRADLPDTLFAAYTTALWLGFLTSISPCPMATNIAAVSYLGSRPGGHRRVMLAGLLYALGRVLTYLVLAVVLVAGLMSMTRLSMTLQGYMNKLLGPVLILAGLFLLGLIKIPVTGSGSGIGEGLRRRAERGGVWGAGLLGVVFAASFCPVSAGLFFGSLVPLSLKSGSRFVLPFLYGIGTALPVIGFALLIALGARSVGKAFNVLTAFEKWARRLTGGVFVVVGIYLAALYIFGVTL